MPIHRVLSVLRAVSVVVLLSALPGCIGVGYIGTERANGLDADAIPPFSRGEWPVTAETLIEKRGEPDTRTAMDDSWERWEYDKGLRWNGPTVFLVIGIPLIVPVGRDSDTFYVRDGLVETVDVVRYYEKGYTFGVSPGVCPDLGFVAWGGKRFD